MRKTAYAAYAHAKSLHGIHWRYMRYAQLRVCAGKRVAGKSYQAIKGSDLTPSFPSSMNHCSIRNNQKHHCIGSNIAVCAIVMIIIAIAATIHKSNE